MTDQKSPLVVAYGMGVDSTAMLIEWHRRGLTDPQYARPDAILFADTGSEKPETIDYLTVINGWLESVGYPLVTILKRSSPIAGDTSLHGECLRKSVLPSLAYGGHSCSLKWKVDPQWAWTKKEFGWTQPRKKRGAEERPAGNWNSGASHVIKLIGYDASPADLRRVKNAVGKWPPGHQYRYPLVEWGYDRAKCIQIVKAAGLPGYNPAFLTDKVNFSRLMWLDHGGVPMKSSCWMCPASKNGEIRWLKKAHPELHSLAIQMEQKAQAKGLRTVKGLGRSKAWQDLDCDGVAFPIPHVSNSTHQGVFA